MSTGALRGAGVLVTRPARQAGSFAQKIAAIGGTPIVFPAVVILPPADASAVQRAHRNLAHYDYAVFVSANAVEYGVPDPRLWPAQLVPFAPGHGTAEVLAGVGIFGTHVPVERQDTDGLLALPEFMSPAGRRVLIFRGNTGREQLAEVLRARGAMVESVCCYTRAKPQSGAMGLIEAFAAARIDAVTVTSSEGLDNLWSWLDVAARTQWLALPIFAPHPRIAEHAAARGLDVVLTTPGDAGILAGLLEWFNTHPYSRNREHSTSRT